MKNTILQHCAAQIVANIKRFQEFVYKTFPNYSETLTILEVVVPIETEDFLNPAIEKMNDLF